MKYLLPFLALLLIGCKDYESKVVYCYDGDSYLLSNDRKVRLGNGIDAPEYNQFFGKEAKVYVETLIKGKQVSITEQGKDKYNRVIVTITLQDGQDLGLLLIRNGYAHASKFSSNEAKREYATAKKKKVGLFAYSYILPYTFRKNLKQSK